LKRVLYLLTDRNRGVQLERRIRKEYPNDILERKSNFRDVGAGSRQRSGQGSVGITPVGVMVRFEIMDYEF